MEYRKRQRGQQKMDERNRRIREDGYEPVHTKYSTIKEQLRQAVDRAVEMTKDEQDFIRIMREQFGIAVRFSRGVISYKHPDREKPIRGRMLGRIYEREQIAERIAGFQQQEEEQRRPEFQGMLRIFFIHSELRLVVDLQTCVKAQQSRAYARQVALSNLQEMARTIAYIQGATGGAGSSAQWYTGTAITGTSTTATIFSGSGISNAKVGDMYLNTSTQNTYRCTVGGAASVAKWVYVSNIKGATGGTGPAGADAITMSITSSNGTIFKNTGVSTTLTAHVYRAGAELSASQIAELGTIKWYKDGSTTPLATTGATLNINASDVINKASYIAQLEG